MGRAMSERDGELIKAIQNQDVDAVRRLLEGGADANCHDEYDNTALGVATDKARWGESEPGLEILRALLGAGADPNRFGKYQTPPLHSAAHRGDDAICRLLVEGGADVRVVESSGDQHSALLAACSGALVWLIELCLEAGADVHHVSAQGHTAMHYVMDLPVYVDDKHERFEAAAERLLAAGAALETVNREWGAPLHWAAGRGGNLRGVEWLLSKGCSLTVATPKGTRPIHMAAKMGNGAIIEALVKAGADVNATDGDGQTPLHYACERPEGTGDAVARLLAAGAEVNARARDGRTPLVLAVASRKTGAKLKGDEARVFAALLSTEVDANVKTKSKTTPLHLFARVGEAALIQRAVDRGAPLEARNKHGWTALHVACARADTEAASALLAAGADRRACTQRARKLKKQKFAAGTTPRAIAKALGNDALATLLR